MALKKREFMPESGNVDTYEVDICRPEEGEEEEGKTVQA